MTVWSRRVLLAVSGSGESDAAPLMATTLAAATDSVLHVVHVGRGHPPWFERHKGLVGWLRQEAQGCMIDGSLRSRPPVDSSPGPTFVRAVVPPTQILEVSGQVGAGLVVLGVRRRGRPRRASAGGVSDRVARNARCPV